LQNRKLCLDIHHAKARPEIQTKGWSVRGSVGSLFSWQDSKEKYQRHKMSLWRHLAYLKGKPQREHSTQAKQQVEETIYSRLSCKTQSCEQGTKLNYLKGSPRREMVLGDIRWLNRSQDRANTHFVRVDARYFCQSTAISG
jgi:hypothetical protein